MATMPSIHTRNDHYDLVSILYHSLQSANTCERYSEDARKEDDEDLARFFDEICENDRKRADLAMELLSKRRK